MKKRTQKIGLIVLISFIAFTSFAQTNYYGVSGNMVTGDFDNDGLKDDIAAFNTTKESPALTLWVNHNGWVNEQEASCILPFDYLSAKSLNEKIVAGDFDNDGFMDDIASIYEVGHNQTSLTVWINNDQSFTPQRWWFGGDFDANQISQSLVVGDFDQDGFVDDIAAFYNYEQLKTKVFVWLSDGSKFAWPGTWWVGNDFNAARIQGTLVSGDFDQDGFHDDLAALYNYSDNFCKAFVWTSQNRKFNWPYTWFAEADFAVGKAKGNVVSGDFDGNGFVDNIAALFQNEEQSSSILVFKRNKKGFDQPETWWYGQEEALTANTRLVVGDFNNNSSLNQIAGLLINESEASLTTWTAENSLFTTPENIWQGIALSADDCVKDGGCLPDNLSEQFKVYPNPNNGVFSIEIPPCNNEWVNITVFNVLGSQVYNAQSQSGIILPITLNELKTGSYTVQISSSEFTLNKSLIIE